MKLRMTLTTNKLMHGIHSKSETPEHVFFINDNFPWGFYFFEFQIEAPITLKNSFLLTMHRNSMHLNFFEACMLWD